VIPWTGQRIRSNGALPGLGLTAGKHDGNVSDPRCNTSGAMKSSQLLTVFLT
jgi:hypothetical protein